MSDLHTAACLAIEALDTIGMPNDAQRTAINALRQALAQRPVAYVERGKQGGRALIWAIGSEALAIEPGTPLFTGSKACG
jgi:hypothetical protein